MAPAAFLADPADGPPQDGGQLRAGSGSPASSVVDALLVSPPALTEKRERALRALLARPMSARRIEQAISGAAGICSGPLRKIGWAEYRDSRWHITPAGRHALGLCDATKETPSETSAATLQGADAPGVTGGINQTPTPARVEGVGVDGAGPSQPPVGAEPEEAEGSSGPNAAAGESPAQSLVPPPCNRHEGLVAQDDLPSDEAGPEVALPRCDGDEGADARPQHSSQAKPDPEPAGEESLPGAPVDPDPAPAREPEPIDAAPVAGARPTVRVVKPGAQEIDWDAILARIDAGERPDVVALDEGVDLKALQERLRARIAENKARAARPAADELVTPSWWTARRDLDLAAGICRDGIAKTCVAMGISREDAKARWDDLMPRKGLAEQNALLGRLRATVSDQEIGRKRA